MQFKKRPPSPEEVYAREQEARRQQKALESYVKSGHARPRTRREFLASGVTSSLGMVALPSLLSLVGREAAALAPECQALEPVGGWTPYIQVILGGGAAIHHNTLVLGEDKQPLDNYSRLGIGNATNFSIRNEFGNVPLAVRPDGQYAGHIMRELISNAGPTAIKNSALVKFCVRSLDDKPNRDSILGLVNAVGQSGSILPNISVNGFTQPAFLKWSAIQKVTSQSGFSASLSPQGVLKTQMADPSRRDALLSLVNRLSSSQRQKLAGSTSGENLGVLVECATGKNIALASHDTSKMDPRNAANIASIWGLSDSTLDTDNSLLHASLTMNILNGNSGAGTLVLGGYDYHGSERIEQDEKDAEGGKVIGRILATAQAMNKPLFLHVTSDGSVEGGGADGTGRQGADAGSRGSGFFILFHPNGRPVISDLQIGHFNTSQASEDSWLSGWNTERAALSVFANYLAWHKKVDQLTKIVPGVFDTGDLKKIVKVA